jgi:RNA polymerase sigma-70 factor (ECF subfamily)
MATGLEDSSTSISLIKRVQRHDPAAWDRLCLIYLPLVYRWARAVGLQNCDAADVGQDVMWTVARRIASFDHHRSGATFRGWLKTITRHKIGDYLKKRARQNETPGDAMGQLVWNEVPEELPDALSSESRFDVKQVILHRIIHVIQAEFEPQTWQAFWLATVEERPIAEIAEQLGMTRQAVRQARYRVLRRLRIELTSFGDQP